MNIAFFASSLVSAYWNGAATYYRGIVRALHGRGHRDLPDPEYATVVVYSADRRSADGTDDVRRQLDRAKHADLIVKASGVGVFDELLESAVASMKRSSNLVAFWDVDARLKDLFARPAAAVITMLNAER